MKNLGFFCLWISSWFKFIAKLCLNKQTTIVDSLTLPGWFVLHNQLVFMKPYNGKVMGMEHHYYDLPLEWNQQLKELVKKDKERKK